ncbi:hypothetical protein B0T22DRAFT_123717 [Podospora appendiculata]|uniref:Regulator of phospholipase D SRF1 n=1 Tax=Podospora appendiculata TaxID=314037 RepID=A0AAE0X7J9_9PEZI|nr:hypothetical protein B0T22DRAFT_123717 [Podospora appendiculata]
MTAAIPSTSNSNQSLQRESSRSRGSVADLHSARRRPPRTLPPWLDSYEEEYGRPTEDQLRILNQPPPPAPTLQPQHNNTPGPPERRVSKDGFIYENPGRYGVEAAGSRRVKIRRFLTRTNGTERGRKWDHLRSAEPVIVHRYTRQGPNSPWPAFLQSSHYGHIPNEDSEIVDVSILEKLQPNFNNPVDVQSPLDATRTRKARTKALYKRVWESILRHPLVPTAFRLTVLLTSIMALALSVRIFEIERTENNSNSSERTQSIVAIVVDTLAIPYIGYMTWDEFKGKPLGLRRPTQKISLVLMDLFFIIFKSASTALAFEALVYHNSQDREVRQYSQALAAFQTVGLISWTLTFTVNVFRLVEKLGGGEDSTPP